MDAGLRSYKVAEGLPPQTRRVVDAVSGERLMAGTRTIAAQVRLSGSPEERDAFAYIERELTAAGLRTQRFEHDALISLPQAATLALLEAGAEAIPCITHSFAASTPPRGLTGPAVYARDGGGGSADVRETIAFVDGLAMPTVVRRLQLAGARGIVFLNRDPVVHEMIVSTVWGSPVPTQVSEFPTIPVVSMGGESAARLRARLSGGQPVACRLATRVLTEWRKLPVLTADLDGAADDSFVLLAGHVDSWHYGAMDNGGANAVMIEVGRVLAQERLHRGLRLAFWSGHSHGRYAGSTWYVDAHWAELEARCAVHLYIDSVGGRGATDLAGGYCMPETRALGARVIGALTGQHYHGARVGRSGDQSLLGIGVPSLFMTLSEHPADGPEASKDFAITGIGTGGLGWWWHTPDDTVDKLDPAALTRDAQVYAGTIHLLCTAAALPLDYGATATDLADALRKLQTQLGARFDLSDCIAETDRLRAEVVRFTQEASPAEVNRALMALGRVLIPVLYTQAGRFDHDPATSIPPLPPLVDAARLADVDPTSDEAKALQIAAVRGRNRLHHALREARRCISR